MLRMELDFHDCDRPATSPVKRSRRKKKSPESFKSARQASSVDYVRPSTMGSPVGRHSDQRFQRREERNALSVIEDDVVSSLMEDFNRKAARRSPVRIRPHSDNYVAFRHGERMVAPTSSSKSEKTPNARVGSEMRLATGVSALGTSQLLGCQGDFCSTDTSKFDSIDSTLVNAQDGDYADLSEFRRNIMRQEYFEENSESIAAENDHALHNALSQTKAMIGTSKYHIAYRIIMQTRQEMPLVKLAIDRYRRGEVGDYVAEDSYSDLITSGKLPSAYYKDVPCCDNCFKIYNLIDKERTKALKKIRREAKDKETGQFWVKKALKEKEIQKKRRGGYGSSAMNSIDKENLLPNKFDFSVGANMGGNSFSLIRDKDKGRRSATISDASNVSSDSKEKADVETSLQNVLKLVEGLTKLDIAEIRTMTKPPAAVEIVLEAVMILLTGKVMGFQEVRKLMGSGESFLLMLREFRISDISDERMQMIEPYVDNPVFRPENVIAVSQCAAKFCGWVLGMTQAARWQRGMYNKHANIIGSGVDPILSTPAGSKYDPNSSISSMGARSLTSVASTENLTFVQKLERRKATRLEERKLGQNYSRGDITRGSESLVSNDTGRKTKTDFKRAPDSISPPKLSKRERTAMANAQARATNRMSDQSGGGNLATVGEPRTFKCADGNVTSCFLNPIYMYSDI